MAISNQPIRDNHQGNPMTTDPWSDPNRLDPNQPYAVQLYGQPAPYQQPQFQMPPEVSIDQRRYYLSMAVSSEVARGARVESQTDTTAIVVTGKPCNHMLHLILTLVTCFMWSIIWFVLALGQKEHRAQITVDQYGQVLRQQLS